MMWRAISGRGVICAIILALCFAGRAAAGALDDGLAALRDGNYATALRLLRPVAEQGDAGAPFNLGLMYDRGQGVPQDYAAAVSWFRKAVDQGNADAQTVLGLMYQGGEGVPQKHGEAVSWLLGAMYVAGVLMFVIVPLGIVSLGIVLCFVGSAYEPERARRQQDARRQQERVWEQEQQQRNQQEARAQQARQQAQEREKEQREKEQARRRQEKQEEVRRQQEGDNERGAKSNGTKAQDWWVVLGTEPNASLETAKQAYRSKIKQYHPDRVEGRGPEFIQLASQKSKELNAALNKAKRYAQA
jgi:hypothetical protein